MEKIEKVVVIDEIDDKENSNNLSSSSKKDLLNDELIEVIKKEIRLKRVNI